MRLLANVLLIPTWLCVIFAVLISYWNIRFAASAGYAAAQLPKVESTIRNAKCDGLNTDIVLNIIQGSVKQSQDFRDLIWAVVFLFLVVGMWNIVTVLRNARTGKR
jgi:hypothetical protein